MNVLSYEKQEKNTAQMSVEIESAIFNTAVDNVYKRMRGRISVPGFRKGKAPRKIIESIYGKSVFIEDALDEVVPTAWAYGIKEQGIRTVGNPQINDVKINDDNSAVVTFIVSLYPEAVLTKYKGIEAVRPNAEITDSEVDTELETLRNRNARVENVERPAINGDTVVIDYDGYLDGVPFDGGQAENYELTLGSNSFIYGFEQKIQGMTVGEERDLDLTFPTSYHAEELAGKDVIFHVKVHEIRSKVLPELDDEFAKDVSEFDTLEEYRADVREKLLKEKEEAAEKEFENNLLEKLVDYLEADIPEAMYDEQIDMNLQQMSNQLSQYGITVEQYFSMSGMGETEARAQMRPTAEKTTRITLALNTLAEMEDIKPTDEEVEEMYKSLAERYGVEIEEARDGIERESVEHDLKIKAAIKIVRENGIALDPPPEEEHDHDHDDHDSHDHDHSGHDHSGHDHEHDHDGHNHSHEHDHDHGDGHDHDHEDAKPKRARAAKKTDDGEEKPKARSRSRRATEDKPE